MTIQNVKPVLKCPQCSTQGYLLAPAGKLVLMECDDTKCGYQWHTMAKVCPECKKPNGYFIDGPCRKCYAEKYMSS